MAIGTTSFYGDGMPGPRDSGLNDEVGGQSGVRLLLNYAKLNGFWTARLKNKGLKIVRCR